MIHYIDVLWDQPIMLVQVASTSNLLENQQNDPFFLQNHSKFIASKIKYEKFGPKNFNSSLKNGSFGALIFQEIEFSEHLKYNFKTS